MLAVSGSEILGEDGIRDDTIDGKASHYRLDMGADLGSDKPCLYLLYMLNMGLYPFEVGCLFSLESGQGILEALTFPLERHEAQVGLAESVDVSEDARIPHAKEGSIKGEIEGIIADEKVQLPIVMHGHPRKRGCRQCLQFLPVDGLFMPLGT